MLGLGSSAHKSPVVFPFYRREANRSVAGARDNDMDTENPDYLITRFSFYTQN